MKWLILSLVLSSQALFASSEVDQLSFLYYKNKINSFEKGIEGEDQCYPHPDSSSCAKVVCANLPSYMCDSADEIKQVTTMCKGNFGGECVARIIKQLPSYQSDSLDEMKDITNQCSGVFGSRCFDFFANKLPAYQLDSRDEVFEVLGQCKNASYDVVDCAVFTCDKLPSYQCDSRDELINVLKSCGN